MKLEIDLPENFVEQIHAEKNDEFKTEIINDDVVIRSGRVVDDKAQTKAITWMLLPTILVTIVFAILLNVAGFDAQNPIPLNIGSLSIENYLKILVPGIGMLSFTVAFFSNNKTLDVLQKKGNLRKFVALFISLSIALELVIGVAMQFLGVVFFEVSFRNIQAIILSFLIFLVTNYMMIYYALTVNPRMMMRLLAVVIIGGVMTSMVSNSEFWHHNFSELGTYRAKDAWIFNGTLIISALLMFTLINYIFLYVRINSTNKIRMIILQILLNLVAIALAGVGIFPSRIKHQYLGIVDPKVISNLHLASAGILVLLVVLAIMFIPLLLPKADKNFYISSYILGGILFVMSLIFEVPNMVTSLKPFSVMNTTTYELFAFILAFAWIFMLLQRLINVSKYGRANISAKVIEI
ncbi:MAG: DUF998 domain-containing protein [Lactobacillaceae bacterium]|jgi:hypothetical protein|nr:DUF998 domain-containing protein [Lactobacillaceae bacterium]